MSKPSRKLSLRKETVRQLDAEQLAQVGGGTDLVMLRQPSKTSNPTGTTSAIYFDYNFNYYYLY